MIPIFSGIEAAENENDQAFDEIGQGHDPENEEDVTPIGARESLDDRIEIVPEGDGKRNARRDQDDQNVNEIFPSAALFRVFGLRVHFVFCHV